MAPRLDSTRVLVVDPDGRSRLRTSSVLLEDGFSVEESDDFLDVVDRVKAGARYDIIVTEAGPQGEGEALTRRFSLLDPSIATILIGNGSGLTGPQALRAMRSGAFDILASTFSSTEFRHVIHRACARRNLLLRDRRATDRIEEEIRRRERAVRGLRGFLPGTGFPVAATVSDQRERFLRAARRFMNSVETADPVASSPGHAMRVERYATFLGRQSGHLDDRDIFHLAAAALFHDIGKIRSEDSDTHVRSHPVIGGRMVRALHGMDLEPSVRHHHEHYDGAGFPDGLRGDEIPFEAQILLAADGFDHMTHPQAGEGSLPAQAAVEELVKGSGRLFAPGVVEIVRANADALDRAGPSGPKEPVDFARAS